MPGLDARLIGQLYDRAGAARWDVPRERFAAALETSVSRGLKGPRSRREIGRYLWSLHLEDLALACACADGHERAWDHFVLTHRPGLYRAADAIDVSGMARESADALYGELFGTRERGGQRQSLFHYFHGRSSLGTWLRAVLAQRHVDTIRAARRIDPLPEGDVLPAPAAEPDPDRRRFIGLMRAALAAAVAALAAGDRLRLNLYYLQGLTLAQIGRMSGEHEATVSRQLARTRMAIRRGVETYLKDTAGLSGAEIEAAFSSVAADAGPLDLTALIESAEPRKIAEPDRSI